VLAYGLADYIDNPEIRLQHSNVTACGLADNSDNSELQCVMQQCVGLRLGG